MTHQPQVTPFLHEDTHTFSYVVKDPASEHCAIIDSVTDFDYAAGGVTFGSADTIIEWVKSQGLIVDWVLETHVHADHLSAAPYIQAALGGKTGIGEHICAVQSVFGSTFNADSAFHRDGSQFDHLFKDGDQFHIGQLKGTIIHTPGHTPACLTYVFGDAAFVGDTLFMPDYGTARCDFPGGDAATLYESIQKVLSLPDETRLFLCHDYGTAERPALSSETTVKAQKQLNVHVHEGISQDAFVSLREERDRTLGMPRLMLPSVQVNMRAGHMPEPEANGVRYLKIPLNCFN
ncbi:MBL fold metallo-hydrolase [Marinobacter sp. BGYM27]|uniref:MBL fold metallo-hydrolase n=1 Tax=Marinobacter sp. BGYM27 TaxID=2975597 RepID=UPI0021A29D25|nr:MBL fold metallo-hydrolase [Marinobacter sp. BGYM27]MDG5500333.1 MBL fold metallo-hydrolase [Marinobacter sp. BGYM27]